LSALAERVVHIDWHNFTPWPALSGGALIGLACALLLLTCGRIAGVSGIVAGLLQPFAAASRWRLAFITGVFLAPTLWRELSPGGLPMARVFASTPGELLPYALGGLLVGVGSRLANGCTSGHGICGLARGSRRSLVAVAVFMSTAVVQVWAVRHVAEVLP
jgi:uncharacterized membrane protein YedE/YeeE